MPKGRAAPATCVAPNLNLIAMQKFAISFTSHGIASSSPTSALLKMTIWRSSTQATCPVTRFSGCPNSCLPQCPTSLSTKLRSSGLDPLTFQATLDLPLTLIPHVERLTFFGRRPSTSAQQLPDNWQRIFFASLAHPQYPKSDSWLKARPQAQMLGPMSPTPTLDRSSPSVDMEFGNLGWILA